MNDAEWLAAQQAEIVQPTCECGHELSEHDTDEDWPHCEGDEGRCSCEGYEAKP